MVRKFQSLQSPQSRKEHQTKRKISDTIIKSKSQVHSINGTPHYACRSDDVSFCWHLQNSDLCMMGYLIMEFELIYQPGYMQEQFS